MAKKAKKSPSINVAIAEASDEDRQKAQEAAIAMVGLSKTYDKELIPANLLTKHGRPEDTTSFLGRKDAAEQFGADGDTVAAFIKKNLPEAKADRVELWSALAHARGSFYAELVPPGQEPGDPGHQWYLFTPKPGVKKGKAPPAELTAKQMQKVTGIARKVGITGDPATTSAIERAVAVALQYKLPSEGLSDFLKTGNTEKIVTRLIEMYDPVQPGLDKQDQLRKFTGELVDAVRPPTLDENWKPLDRSVHEAEIKRRTENNVLAADRLYGLIVSEMMANRRIPGPDGFFLPGPNVRAEQIMDQIRILAKTDYGDGETISDGFKEALTNALDPGAEGEMRKPIWTTGNQAHFMLGDATWKSDLADLDGMTQRAQAGGKGLHVRYVTWKHYGQEDDSPEDYAGQLTEALIRAANAGVRVSVLVDGKVSLSDAEERGMLDQMRAHGIATEQFGKLSPLHNNHFKIKIFGDIQGNHGKAVFVSEAGGQNTEWMYYNSWLDGGVRVAGPMVLEDELYVRELQEKSILLNARQGSSGTVDELRLENDRDSHGLDDPLPKSEDIERPGTVEGVSYHRMPGTGALDSGIIGMLAGPVIGKGVYTMVQPYFLNPLPTAGVNVVKETLRIAITKGTNIEVIKNSYKTTDLPQLELKAAEFCNDLLREFGEGGVYREELIQARMARGMSRAQAEDSTGFLAIYEKEPWEGRFGKTAHLKGGYDSNKYVQMVSNNMHPNEVKQHEGGKQLFSEGLNKETRSQLDALKNDPAKFRRYTQPNIPMPPPTAKDPFILNIFSAFKWEL